MRPWLELLLSQKRDRGLPVPWNHLKADMLYKAICRVKAKSLLGIYRAPGSSVSRAPDFRSRGQEIETRAEHLVEGSDST